MVIHCKEKFDDHSQENVKYQDYFKLFPYELSDFQKWSIYAIVNGHHTLVTAHTGSGKTLPAEFAIQYFKERNKKVIYTGPIKALCNQKLYDMRNKFPDISFGILTGDVKDNPEADVLIMTTEILRNTLFTKKINDTNKGSAGESSKNVALQFEMDIDNELGAVVFDEVHYIGDQDRGSVWEQAILLLPQQIQLILLSATIEKPEIFADWLESEKNKNMEELGIQKKELYMTTTHTRVVPLTHYAWMSCQPSVIQAEKNSEFGRKLRELTNKPIQLASTYGKFEEINYHKIYDLQNILQKNKIIVKRTFVLNELVKYLYRKEWLPAICFIFSRKNVELAAKEITMSLFEKDDKVPSIIEKECEKILMSKLKNYREYIDLEEYRDMISLLKKGIAIHHAGIMPVLREMVELLFEKKYIKLLFATETFAVGINMPTKTVIFTALNKYSGNGMRNLLPHEYTQMAGRAGRRGIDTVGHVIHCNNLFNMNSNANEYRNMLTGPPKMLTSQFKISYNLIISIISANKNDLLKNVNNGLITFMEKSFMQTDIVKEINNYDRCQKELEEDIARQEAELLDTTIVKTEKSVLKSYFDLKKKIELVPNKQKKKIAREIDVIESDNRFLKNDIIKYNELEKTKLEIEKNNGFKLNAINYIQNNVDLIIGILRDNKFMDISFELTEKAIVAMQLQEVHCLALAELYENMDGFRNISDKQLACLFSCFTNISIPEDKRLSIPDCRDNDVRTALKKYSDYLNKYYDLECEYQVDTGSDYTLHYELIDYIAEWCDADDEIKCKNLIIKIKNEKEIFLGEFVKAILKINNIAAEFEKISESLQNINLLQKMKNIPVLTQKYVATNQSLYI
tara:strand:+ start:8137 stop:10701 length:2565 start_codon:yes stop_codon:yes gene_type:complete